MTTEFNTLFETITSIAEKVDPVKLNMTLSAAAEALTGLGGKFGQSIVNANTILDDLNPKMPVIRGDVQKLADLADVYAKASPDLWSALDNAVTTARTLNQQQGDLDAALLATAGSPTPAPTSSNAAAPTSSAPWLTPFPRRSSSTPTAPSCSARSVVRPKRCRWRRAPSVATASWT